ncbi:YfhJ family protein [Kurthia sp. YJT4]|uniref:YfhJ family protein n=1 Tax=Kurthia sp. YJT4 TaxID=3049086 RepID=UPI00254FE58B|nr:YfhJ family protein [Kurthia sp. YJT4]WIL38135.1 YfhJ family protein [Kurthia sp. YJT4]
MKTKIQELAELLQQSNENLSEEKARTWIELLWSDFESTYAQAGYSYKGEEMTEKMVRQWIESYGSTLHEFVARNPKYKDLLN